MDGKKIAQLLFPEVTESVEDIFKKYPPRKLKEGQVVSRFAPSPTGFMHIGNFFQMFISYNLCRVTDGIFFLRIEDTDSKREVKEAKKVIYDILSRYDIHPNEYQTLEGKDVGDYGPYVQSERKEIYKVFAKKLVQEGKAFPCFCRKTEGKDDVLKLRENKFVEDDEKEYDPCRDLSYEEVKKHIDNGESFAIRLKTKNTGKERVKFYDLIKGEIEAKANAKDFVILKSDGVPPYPFAHVVDDTLMGTTIVVRGEEYISSTPMHIELFEALGLKPTLYCHNPLICKIDENGNKSKFSKRYADADMRYYSEEGYPKTAVLEYLLNIINSGFEIWRAKNQDAKWQDFTFSVKEITAVAPAFDIVKFNDVAKNIIAKMSAEEVYLAWLDWAKEFDLPLAKWLEEHKDYAVGFLSIDRGGVKPRKDIYKWSMIKNETFSYMFARPHFEELLPEDKEKCEEFLKEYCKDFLFPQSNEEWFAGVKRTAERLGYAIDNKAYKQNPEAYKGNTAKACEFVRLALTGRRNSPNLFEIMRVLGEKETKERLQSELK